MINRDVVELHHEYQRAAQLGWRLLPGNPEDIASAHRLRDAGLANINGELFALMRPEYAAAKFPDEELALLQHYYLEWLRAERVSLGEELLYGRSGFWQHGWNLLHELDEFPMRMDFVFPDVPVADDENWFADGNIEVLKNAAANEFLKVRLLLPPRDPHSSIAAVADEMTQMGFEVRVRSSPFLFAVYEGKAAVLGDQMNLAGEEGYFLTRRSSIVTPLQGVFQDHWKSALTWESYGKGASDVLELMSLGWTDVRIAEHLGQSMRTISRRVSEAMAAAGVASRFELGMKFAETRIRGVDTR